MPAVTAVAAVWYFTSSSPGSVCHHADWMPLWQMMSCEDLLARHILHAAPNGKVQGAVVELSSSMVPGNYLEEPSRRLTTGYC